MSKTVNTRIKLKYDTLANWQTNNPTLLEGEMAVVSVPADETHADDAAPVMFKVGDGKTTFTNLPWASATAADVYTWAKQADTGNFLKIDSNNKIALNTSANIGGTNNDLYLMGQKAGDNNTLYFDTYTQLNGATLMLGMLGAGPKGKLIATYFRANDDGAPELSLPATGTSGTIATTNDIVQSDWNVTDTTSKAYINNRPKINNASLTLQVNGATKTTFYANDDANRTFNVSASDLGLSSAMKFGGISAQTLSEGGTQNAGATSGNYTVANQPSNGTVYLDKAGHLEYVWVSGTSSVLGHWELLGQDGSYALSSTTIAGTGMLDGGGNLTANRTITHKVGSAPSKTSGFYKFSTDAYSHISAVTAVTKTDITNLGIPGQNTTYSAATSSALGLIKVGYTTSGKNYKVQLDTGNNAYVSVPWTDTNTWRPIMVGDSTLSSTDSLRLLTLAPGVAATGSSDYISINYAGSGNITFTTGSKVVTTADEVIIDCGSSSKNVFAAS